MSKIFNRLIYYNTLHKCDTSISYSLLLMQTLTFSQLSGRDK